MLSWRFYIKLFRILSILADFLKRYHFELSSSAVVRMYVSFSNQRFNVFSGENFGSGSYFSSTSQYSLRFSSNPGEKGIILAKVITGEYQVGIRKQKTPVQGCHSTVNNQSAPSIFVVYHDAAAYPEYLIKFTHERCFNSPAPTLSRDRQLVAGHPPVTVNYPLQRSTYVNLLTSQSGRFWNHP